MNAKQMDLVRQTCKEVAPIADSAADLFYTKLFQIDPALRPVFAAQLDNRGRRLMQMVEAAAGALDKPATLAPALAGLGSRQVASTTSDHRYETVGAALILTFRQGLGPAFTPEARQAWIELFDSIDGVLKKEKTGSAPGTSGPLFATAA
jgi:hemoglobin-like flavoprotein